jgi:hypothetical protein
MIVGRHDGNPQPLREKTMPRLNISRDTYNRLKAFLALGEQLLGESMTVEQCAEALMFMGMRATLDGIWKPHDPNTLIDTLQNLATTYPQQVYPFLADILKTGQQIIQEREQDSPTLGFRPQTVGKQAED